MPHRHPKTYAPSTQAELSCHRSSMPSLSGLTGNISRIWASPLEDLVLAAVVHRLSSQCETRR
jgi:hypothetical protein